MFRKEFGKANVTSLVERVSRFAVVLKNPDRQSKTVMESLIGSLSPLPASARRSITFDRGTEFTAWKHLKAGLGVDTWFCDPQSPWQKGTVENTNNRLRRYLPRKADPTAFTNRYLKSICDRLNATPRKCLGYQTPAEVFRGADVPSDRWFTACARTESGTENENNSSARQETFHQVKMEKGTVAFHRWPAKEKLLFN